MNKTKIVVVSGGFDPCHSGHILLCNSAKALGDYLIVGVNSDNWLIRKKGQAFMPWNERAELINNLKSVDEVMSFDDSNNTACDLLEQIKAKYKKCEIIFANGGDRTSVNIPEMAVEGINFQFGIGGEYKANSSSWILQEWKAPKTERGWGYYRVLHEQTREVKLKELTVDPGKYLSMQRHQSRAEHWFVAEGTATVYTINRSTDTELLGVYNKFDSLHIKRTEWHQLVNETNKPLKIIEIQYGENCVEEDIERQ